MPIEARVARTAHDLQHLNRLRVPKFGVLDLHVEIPSGPASKTYLQEGFTPERTDGRDDFHFAPVAETAKIVYRIDDPLQQLTGGKLELFRQQNATAIWHHYLTPEEVRDGEHRIDWTGERFSAMESFSPPEDFPDHCVTAQHSPYKLKLTLSSDRESRGAMVAWTYFHVLVHEIEVDIGPRTVLSQDRDKNLYDTLGTTLFGIDYAANGSPGARRAEGAVKEIRLLSNIFQTGVAEMTNNTDFQQYQTAWGDGPNIPVFAKIWIKNSGGQRVQAPRACGGVKLLWDWEDVTEVTTQYNTDTKTFVDNTLNFDKQTTRPRGDNCHHDRGGKRGPGSNKVFPVTAGVAPAAHVAPGTFPFKVEACPTRTFAALSTAWGSGLYGGQSGVLFQPSRMAGDAFKVTVYFAYEKKADGRSFAIDDLDAVPPLHTTVKKTLPATYQIWRRIDVVNQKKKKASTPDFPIAPFQGYYERGYVRMIASTAVTTWPQAEYNTKVANAVTGIANVFVTASIDSTVDQWAAGEYAVHFRSYNAFKTALQAAQGWTNAQMTAWFASAAATSINSSQRYHHWLSGIADTILRQVCGAYISAQQGVNVFRTLGLYNLETSPGGELLNGYQADFPGTGRNKAALVLCANANAYSGTSNRLEQTAAHEIGHALFFAHAPDGVTATDPANAPDVPGHDTVWHHCTMSYNFSAERKFCGMCVLRLRGWDRNHFTNVSANNRRPP
jgi:hypothetical protein